MTDENGWPVVKAGLCDENALRVLQRPFFSLYEAHHLFLLWLAL
ncbi:MAG: hypothetical protein NTY37_10430 [Methanothrix sp.]|nr:hypothetical protein [Methanothrix sp.]